MGHKILDVKADIHEDVEAFFQNHCDDDFRERYGMVKEHILDIVDEHFEKIER